MGDPTTAAEADRECIAAALRLLVAEVAAIRGLRGRDFIRALPWGTTLDAMDSGSDYLHGDDALSHPAVVALHSRLDASADTLIARLRATRPEWPLELAYHPDADPGDGSGWAVLHGDRYHYGDLLDALRSALAEVPRG